MPENPKCQSLKLPLRGAGLDFRHRKVLTRGDSSSSSSLLLSYTLSYILIGAVGIQEFAKAGDVLRLLCNLSSCSCLDIKV